MYIKTIKKFYYRLLGTLCLIGTGLLLNACTNITEEENIIDEPLSMEEEADISYEVPSSSPHILVDQLGYLPDSTKQVFFFGESMPETFALYNADTKEKVFTGLIEERGYNDVYGTLVGVGDFTNFDRNGDYYIEADLLGDSYEFSIKEDIYADLFNEALRSYYYNRCGVTLTEATAGDNAHNACHTMGGVLRSDITVTMDISGGWHEDLTGSKKVTNAVYPLSVLMLAYEIHPKAFTDDINISESGNGIPDILDEIKYEIDWLLKLQDQDTGAVYSAVTIAESNNKSIAYVEDANIDSAFAFAYALSKFSYLYQAYDKEYATNCLRAADRAYKYAGLNKTEESEYEFPAAVEIYRASGHKDCKKYLKEFFKDPEHQKCLDGIGYYGQITYLNTTQKVDVKVCSQIMKNIMLKAEEISAKSKSGAFLVPADAEQTNNKELLNNMITMTLVDYIITNHEYDTIIENYLHFFLGRNLKSITYLDGVGTNNYLNINDSLGIMKQFDDNAALVLLLSKINN